MGRADRCAAGDAVAPPAALFGPNGGGDAWFQAEIPRALANMVDSQSNHYRTKVHPIASIIIYPLAATSHNRRMATC